MMSISYACGVLNSLSDPDGINHSDNTIMAAIEVALQDDGHNVKKKDLRNGLRWLFEKVTSK